MKNNGFFFSENFQFFVMIFSIYLNRRVFKMLRDEQHGCLTNESQLKQNVSRIFTYGYIHEIKLPLLVLHFCSTFVFL